MTNLHLETTGPLIASEGDFLDHLGNAWWSGADCIVVPASRLSPDFFRLGTGLAGAILQKCSNYQMKIAIVGDISTYTARSAPLRDFVFESNKRGDVRFLASEAEL